MIFCRNIRIATVIARKTASFCDPRHLNDDLLQH